MQIYSFFYKHKKTEKINLFMLIDEKKNEAILIIAPFVVEV